MENIKPWLDSKGKLLDDETIIKKSENWPASIWEEYLRTLEYNPSNRDLSLFDEANKVENYSEDDHEKEYVEYITTDEFPLLEKSLEEILRKISKREYEVLYLIFWEGLSERQIAKKLKTNRSAVSNYKKSALEKIKKRIKNGEVQKNAVVKNFFSIVVKELSYPQLGQFHGHFGL